MTRRRIGHWLGATCLFALGLDALTLTSLAQLVGALAALVLALGWATFALLFLASATGRIFPRRKQLAVLVASIAFATLLGLFLAAKIRMGPTAAFQREHFRPSEKVKDQQSDPEIGWAPTGPDALVGQRLDTIDPARTHILMMGDSILYGSRVEAHETAPFLMGKQIRDHQVLNLSVSGYSVEQYWLYLKRVLPRTRPRLIVIGIFTGNDFQLTGRELTPWGHSKPLFHVEDGALVRVNSAEDCIDDLSQSLLFRAAWHDKERALALSHLLCAPRELRMGELERLLARLFVEIETLGRDAGAKVVFALLPNRHELDVYQPDETFYLSKYEPLKRLLREGHHEILDTYPELLRHPRDELDRAFQSDSSHFTPLGHQILADLLLRAIDERGYLR